MPSRRIAAILAALAVSVAAPSTAHAVVEPRTADAEAPLLTQFNNVNTAVGTVGIADGGYGDAHAIAATYSGGGQNGYARGLFDVDWRDGDDTWYSAAYFLPAGFKAAMQGQVAIMRWDDYGAHPEGASQGGIVINGGDRRARLVLNQMPAATQTQLTDSFDLPEGRWFHLEVHQVLRADGGFNEVFIDGTRVAVSNAANLAPGRGADRLRFGIVAIGGGAQTNPLSLQFDHARVSTSQAGPNPQLARPVEVAPPAPTAPTTPTTTTTTPTSTNTSTSTTTSRTRPPKKRSTKVSAARYTPRVRKCVNRALKRAAKRGDVTRLDKSVRRCVSKYGVRTARRR